ncbi:MAG: toxin-antitoxin system YwqK family antitoxin [bacterium]
MLVVKGKKQDGMWGEARLDTRALGQLNWSSDGRLLHERRFDAQGRVHGIETERDESGRVVWCATWVDGSMHGPAVQFDDRGRPVLVTHFVRGCGTDIWASCGKVTELRELVDGVPHGLERWGDPRRPWEEGSFFAGQRHGIFREWKSDGTLRKGFPRYYVNGNQVSRRAYDAARASDPSLPPYVARKDLNKRRLPRAVREAFERARNLRRELVLVERARRLPRNALSF